MSHQRPGDADAAGLWTTLLSIQETVTSIKFEGKERWGFAACLQERISTCKVLFLMLQAKEMQQMVKLEAEMDRRPATVV